MTLGDIYPKCKKIAPVSVYSKSSKIYIYDSTCDTIPELKKILEVYGNTEILEIKMRCLSKTQSEIVLTI